MHRRTTRARVGAPLSIAVLILALVACGSRQALTFQLDALNDSGVSGTAVLTDLGDGSTQVVIDVDPAGHPQMPAHIHPGTCLDLVPQPLYPLEIVADGASDTVVPAALADLLAGELALNLHVSAADMGTYAACVDLN